MSSGPQQTILFRFIAFFARLQVGYLVRASKNPRIVAIFFAVSAGVTALGTITAVAYLTDLPLLFPPLAASAFILFNSPLSEGESPRSVILSHTIALFSGLASMHVFLMAFSESGLLNPMELSWPRVGAIALAMGITSILMITIRCVHPAAAATGLIASMGFVLNAVQILGYLSAVILLVLEAFLLNRVLGGLPYPSWQYDPKAVEDFQLLTGISDVRKNYWEQLSLRIFQRR